MPLDPNIILQAQPVDLQSAGRNVLLGAQTMSALQSEALQRDALAQRINELKAGQDARVATEQAQAASTQSEADLSNKKVLFDDLFSAASTIKPLLESKDNISALREAHTVKQNIMDRVESGKIDPNNAQRAISSIDQFINALEQGNDGAAATMIDQIISQKPTSYRPYTQMVDVVKDGQTYSVPYDTRASRYLWDQAQVSPKTPSQQGLVSEARKTGEVTGEVRATAKIDLPKVESNAIYLKGLVNDLINHPAFESVVGMPSLGKGMQFVSGSPEADFRSLMKQVTGKQFMQAYETLKGGGQITEIEGQKATEAMSRLQTATSEKAFREAAQDFISEIDRLTKLAAQRAGESQPVKKFKYNPETGKIE